MLETVQSDTELRQSFSRLGFITASEKMLGVLRQAQKAAIVSDLTVLVEGETGTGKQILAHAIHSLDPKRGSAAFVTVHCSTVNESLAESELFGHERGAFSGAVSDRRGLFKAAHGGTLFLDDVNDLPLSLQAKLLDVLQRGIVRSVGSDKEARVDVRVIAAANQPIAPLVRENRFRIDLFHRLNVVKLVLPPLRERVQELPLLLLEFARRHAHIYPNILTVAPCLVDFLAGLPFRGNVRELEHTVERMLFAKTEGCELKLEDWISQKAADPECLGGEACCSADGLVESAAEALWQTISEHRVSYEEAIQQVERKILESALRFGGRTRREIASRLRTSERTLYHKLRSFKLTGVEEPVPSTH